MRYTWLEVLQDKWPVGLAAFVVALIATPVVRHIAYRAKLVDRPDDFLKPHARPVAYLGGVAICLGLLTGLGAYIAIMPDLRQHGDALWRSLSGGRLADLLPNPLWNMLAIAAGSVVIMVVGLTDDIREIRARQKVLGQVLAGAILLAGGVGYRMAITLFSLAGLHAPVWVVVPMSLLMCMVAVIAACNATNLLDGLDGLCGGVSGIIAIGFLALAAWLAMWGRAPAPDALRVALCFAMAGAVLGFLPYNIPPASIFLGDAGSMLLGFFVATMMALFSQEGTARWLLAACVVFALPILDTALAVVRRILAGQNIFTGDRAHLYDQLVDRGMTVKRVVVLFYFLALAAAAVGVAVAVFVRTRYAVLGYAGLLAIIWTGFYKSGMLKPPGQSRGAAGKGTENGVRDTATSLGKEPGTE